MNCFMMPLRVIAVLAEVENWSRQWTGCIHSWLYRLLLSITTVARDSYLRFSADLLLLLPRYCLLPARSQHHPRSLRRPHRKVPVDPRPGPQMHLAQLRVDVDIWQRLSLGRLREPVLAKDLWLLHSSHLEPVLVCLVQLSSPSSVHFQLRLRSQRLEQHIQQHLRVDLGWDLLAEAGQHAHHRDATVALRARGEEVVVQLQPVELARGIDHRGLERGVGIHQAVLALLDVVAGRLTLAVLDVHLLDLDEPAAVR